MTKRRLLTMAVILTVLGSVVAIRTVAPATSVTTTPQSASMSVDELQRKIDVRSLPELEIRDLYMEGATLK